MLWMWCAWESSEKLFKNTRRPDPSPEASDLGGLGEAQELEFFKKAPQPQLWSIALRYTEVGYSL